jgi:hypothetical protein
MKVCLNKQTRISNLSVNAAFAQRLMITILMILICNSPDNHCCQLRDKLKPQLSVILGEAMNLHIAETKDKILRFAQNDRG